LRSPSSLQFGKKLAAFSALGGDCGSSVAGGRPMHLSRQGAIGDLRGSRPADARVAFVKAWARGTARLLALARGSPRLVSSPLSAGAGALSGARGGLDVLAFCFRRFMLFTIL